jgi:hypothetical protein
MAQLWYDVVPHENGWAIVITPSRTDSFPTKHAAYDAAVQYARKLRFAGYSVQVRVQHRMEQVLSSRRRRPDNRRFGAADLGLVSASAPACRRMSDPC